jgi:hypothetical protein
MNNQNITFYPRNRQWNNLSDCSAELCLRRGLLFCGGGMNQMEYTFGIGYDLLKVTKAVMEEDDDTFINGETGEEINFWDDGYFDNAEMEGVPV